MPELAEVEFYRKEWNCGLDQPLLAVHLHATKRIFRGTDTAKLESTLPGAKLLSSTTHGKQMLFHFTKNAWLGIHLGMSGKLRSEAASYTPLKHDHLVLKQKRCTLVFSDPRQFGRVLFHVGKEEPAWWSKLPPRIGSKEFTPEHFKVLLKRHGKAPIKAVLLMQHGFPGVGNWMADEILWQSKVPPQTHAGTISGPSVRNLYEKTLFVCAEALRIIGKDFSDPPKNWLFQHRWKKHGNCPRCKEALKHSTIGGRTTCWCPNCQKRA